MTKLSVEVWFKPKWYTIKNVKRFDFTLEDLPYDIYEIIIQDSVLEAEMESSRSNS